MREPPNANVDQRLGEIRRGIQGRKASSPWVGALALGFIFGAGVLTTLWFQAWAATLRLLCK